jgi:beta-galactosidase
LLSPSCLYRRLHHRNPMTVKKILIPLLTASLCSLLQATPTPSPQGPLVPLSSTRSEIVLNGAWLFQPAEAGASQPSADWGSIQVPGSWFPVRKTIPGILEQGTGEAWKAISDSTSSAWYERPIEIPANWAGKEILVNFERVSTDALVFLDNKEVGRLVWPSGELNLTSAATPGKPQTLRLYITATPDAMTLDYMGIGQNTVQKANLETRGITGDVVLSSAPKGTRIGGVFIQPSVRNKKLGLQVEWSGKAPTAAVPCEVVAKTWPDGQEAKRWTVELPAGEASSVSLDWADPKLWDYTQPHLYTLSISAKGTGLTDEVVERFGFREWRIEGRNLFLNEIPFRPQPVNLASGYNTPPGFGNAKAASALLDLHISRGLGLGWEWPQPFFQRGKPFGQKMLATVADEKGFPILGNLYRLNEFVNDKDFKNIWPQNKERWEKLTREEWRKYRNHPSVVGWLLSGNLGPKHADQDPRNIGRSDWNADETNKLQQQVTQFMHGMDPGRSVLFGAAAWSGDIYSAMTYLNFIPLQEREEWLSEWATSGTMPFVAIEFGTPLQNSYMRGRNHFGPSGETEPWLSEFAAIYLGTDAYKESQTYRRAVRSKFEKGSKFNSFNFDTAMVGDPVYQSIQDLFIRNTWRAWRGLNAGWIGMLSWADDFNFAKAGGEDKLSLLEEFKPGMRGVFPPAISPAALAQTYRDEKAFKIRPGGEQLLQQGQPTLAYIAGAADAYTAKDHNYRTGQSLKKQMLVVNDTRSVQSVEATWTVLLGGKELGKGALTGSVAPGTSQMMPFELALPPFEKPQSQPVEGEIKLSAKIGQTVCQDSFAFRVFSPEPKTSPIKTSVVVADPLGKTTAWLTSLGVSCKPWDGKPPAAGSVLVVGRQALSGDPAKAPKLADIETFVTQGGRLLVMPQDADWCRQYLGLRATRHSTRRMWPVQADHPVMAGLPVAALRDWAGSSTMQEAKPLYASNEFPPHGWRWGQRGVLGAAVLEKPHLSGWRPIFEGEFDLQYAPVMELDCGKGRATWCSLDFEDQSAADPAAEKLGRNLLKYVAEAPLAPRVAKTVYVGGEQGEKWLKSLNLTFEKGTGLDPSAPITVVASDAQLDPGSLWSYVERGGKVFFLGHPQGGADYYGAKTLLEKNFRGSITPPVGPEFAGLSASDLRLKSDMDWRILAPVEVPGFERLSDGMLGRQKKGKGVAVWAQVGDYLLLGDKKELPEYLRFTRWRQSRACAQILANLGAQFDTDTRVFRPQVERLSLAGPWQVKITQELPVVDWKNKHPDPGISAAAKEAITAPATGGSGWSEFALPAWYPPFEKVCGEAVWKREISVPDDWAGKIVQLNIGAIKSYDTVYWNGQQVGTTSKESQAEDPWNLPRKYRVSGDLVKAGKNTITIRQFAPDKQGGIHGLAADFNLRVLSGSKQAAPLYHPNYREEFETGDEPYRYIRW